MTVSEYEQRRRAQIANNQALLISLGLPAKPSVPGAHLIKTETASVGKPATKPTRKRAAPKTTPDSELAPRRQSKRLRGLPAGNGPAKAGDASQADAADGLANIRVGPTPMDPEVQLKGWNGGLFSSLGREAGGDNDDDDDDEWKSGSDNPDVTQLRQRFNKLGLWRDQDPNSLRITDERVYSTLFHPTATKPVVFAGDKVGNFGVLDGAYTAATGKEDDDEDSESESDGCITKSQIHSRTVSVIAVSPDNPSSVLTASYDGSIRRFDLVRGVSVELFSPFAGTASHDHWDFIGFSGIQVVDSDPNTIYYSTLGGHFGIHDVRAPARPAGPGSDEPGTSTGMRLQLLEKKIGGFTINRKKPHLLATASLDRTVRIWDLRRLDPDWENSASSSDQDGSDPLTGPDANPALLGTHVNRLSVSHAAFNDNSQVATTSYDDTIKIYDFSSSCAADDYQPGRTLTESEMTPVSVIKHNNQTGRWVSILKPSWQTEPRDGLGQRFCVGNMGRWVDIYMANGDLAGQLAGTESIRLTAVPAVCAFHPTHDWVVGGTARGRMCLWV